MQWPLETPMPWSSAQRLFSKTFCRVQILSNRFALEEPCLVSCNRDLHYFIYLNLLAHLHTSTPSTIFDKTEFQLSLKNLYSSSFQTWKCRKQCWSISPYCSAAIFVRQSGTSVQLLPTTSSGSTKIWSRSSVTWIERNTSCPKALSSPTTRPGKCFWSLMSFLELQST